MAANSRGPSNRPHTRADAAAVALAGAVIRWRWLVILLCVLSVLGLASGGRFLEFSTNYRVFFSSENPELTAFENLQDTYTKQDNFLIVLKPDSGANGGDVFAPEVLKAVLWATKEAWRIPYAIRVDSITNFQNTEAEEDDLTVADLVTDPNGLSQEERDAKRAAALSEPLLVGQLITPEADATGINVVLQYPEKSLQEVPEAVAKAREIVAKLKADYPGITVALTGVSMMNNTFVESSMRDLGSLVPGMYAVLLIITLLALRMVSGTVATLLLIAFSTLGAMGVGGFLGVELTPVSMTAPTIILTLAIADSIHILISFRIAMRNGLDKTAALVEAIRVNFLAVTITSLTTIVGFLTLNFSDSPPFNHLGNITAAGIAVAWALSITLLPALMSLMPVRIKAVGTVGDGAARSTVMGGFADFVTGRWRALLMTGGVASVLLAAAAPTIELNDSWTKYFDTAIEFRRDTDYAVANLAGLYPVEFSLPAKEPGGVSDPEYLAVLERFTDYLRDDPVVRHVYSLSDIMKRLNKNMHGDDRGWYRIPEERDLAAQYLLLYELSLPYGLDLNDRVNIDKSATRVTATLDDVSTRQTREFLDRAEGWLAANAPEYMRTKATGAQVMFSHIAERNIDSMLTGNVIAVVAIGLIMILALRSLTLGLVSIIPNGIPITIAFGVWALLVGVAGLATATVTATALGIVVDDTVHFLTKYLRARRERGESVPDAIRYAFETVGLAIVVNTVILAIGFSVLALSSFKINAELGLMTAIAVVAASIFDFIVLPAMLMLGARLKGDKADRDDTSPDQEKSDSNKGVRHAAA